MSFQEELENILFNYSGTMLIVSHDRYFINKLATSVLELNKDGVCRYDGDYSYYLEKKRKVAERANRSLNL